MSEASLSCRLSLSLSILFLRGPLFCVFFYNSSVFLCLLLIESLCEILAETCLSTI